MTKNVSSFSNASINYNMKTVLNFILFIFDKNTVLVGVGFQQRAKCIGVFDSEQHHADNQRLTSKYRESDSKTHGAVIILYIDQWEPSALCSSRGALMSYNDRSCAVPLH